MKQIKLYTDGACSGNPGVGGWGAVLCYGEHKKELSGSEKATTNNRMELRAVIEGLRAVNEPCQIEVYSDSAYVVNAFINSWIEAWQSNGWKTANKKPVQNMDLWQELLSFFDKHIIKFIKVKGHADNELNNRCDLLATTAIKAHKQ